MKITKKVFTGNGESEADLMESLDNKNIYFRQYFEVSGFTGLNFSSEKEILDYLESKNDNPDMPYFIAGDDIYYQESIGDKVLRYFGTIKD